MPIKLSGLEEFWASPDIGKVEVFEPKTAFSVICASAFAVTSALISLFSKTASTIKSAPLSSS